MKDAHDLIMNLYRARTERSRARREALAKRHAKRAKYKKQTPCIDPRDLPVEAENKILSERGRIGGLNSRKAKA